MKTTTISLNGKWQLTGRPQETPNSSKIEISAVVPGCVQLDLAREGFLPKDLFMGENILETEKYEDWEWWYERKFISPKERENVFLVFEGVDCIAEYYINGVKIGESENMFIAHEFEIGQYLSDGENTLTVHIKSPLIAAHNEEYDVNVAMSWVSTERVGVRKAAHSYGWDIMGRAVTSGLWRDVKIEVRDEIRFSQLYFQTTENRCQVTYDLHCKWAELKDLEIELEGSCGQRSKFLKREKVKAAKLGRILFPIENPQKWFPYGYGEPNIYDGTARIYHRGEVVHEVPFSFGLRTVQLERTDTTDGTSGKFRFLINGVEIMCKGSNWVPLDVFHSRDAGRYDEALALVKDIGCNILRCWGGNVYEDHAFFDFCDRNGIMVWQDFAMACSQYPQNEKFKKLITEEVKSVVRKLRNHPSIILWAGDNEVDVVLYGFGMKGSSNHITREWIPQVLELNDIGRPYIPSSPYLADTIFENRNYNAIPEDHLWGVRDYFKSDDYKHNQAHFVSETGYHGCPSLESIKKFITPKKVWPYTDNSEWILHSSDQNGNPYRVMLMEKQVRQLFGTVPTEPEEYILASQISQAEAKKYFIERMRVGRPNKTGIIWWNLLDGWPQMSDAVVDYYFTKKLAYHYIKRSQAPFVIAIDEISNWNLRVVACNDTLEPKKGHFIVKDAQKGEILLEWDFQAKENGVTLIGEIPTYYSDQKMLIIEWDIAGEKGFNHYLCGYPPISFEMYKEVMEKYHLTES